MITKQDTWGIVLAGHWNRMIFTPDWVGERLFREDEVETRIALLPIFPVIYRHDQVTLEASAPRLIFRPRYNTEASLKAAERMAVTVLRDLPNTPLLGVGINFNFVERDPPRELLELFTLGDAAALIRAGLDTQETKLTRSLNSEHGVMMLTLSYDNESVSIEINFHTETPGSTTTANQTAMAAVDGRVVQLRDAALALLRDTYDLRLEEEEEDE